MEVPPANLYLYLIFLRDAPGDPSLESDWEQGADGLGAAPAVFPPQILKHHLSRISQLKPYFESAPLIDTHLLEKITF